jgi:hypothetical protein
MWEIEITDEFKAWYLSLTIAEKEEITERVDALAEIGPNAKRPLVGEVKGTKLGARLKALRVSAGQAEFRILFVFDPRQTAILLLGGDKAQAGYSRWYRKATDEAVRLYDEHLRTLREEGLI